MTAMIALLLCAFVSLAQGTPPIPVFGNAYSMKGVMSATQNPDPVNLEVYLNIEKNISRVDYFGKVQTYQFPADAKYGVEFIVIPSEGNLCIRVDGTAAEPIALKGSLPDLSMFQFKGSEYVDKVFAEKWERNHEDPPIIHSDKHIMHVRNKGNGKVATPIRYSIKRVNRLYYVKDDLYMIDFSDMTPIDSDSEVFELQINADECQKAKVEEAHTKLWTMKGENVQRQAIVETTMAPAVDAGKKEESSSKKAEPSSKTAEPSSKTAEPSSKTAEPSSKKLIKKN